MGATTWVTLREIDERHGVPKGTAFRAFKALAPALAEGADFRVLAAAADAAEIDALRRAGRIYRASANVLLLSPAAAARLRIAARAPGV